MLNLGYPIQIFIFRLQPLVIPFNPFYAKGHVAGSPWRLGAEFLTFSTSHDLKPRTFGFRGFLLSAI